MTNPDREELVKLADYFNDAPDSHASVAINVPKQRALVVTALRRLASSDGGVKGEPEPVAWRYRYNGKWYVSDIKAFAKAGLDVTPLYTAPPADAGMREALEPFANIANGYDDELDGDDRPVGPVQLKFCRNARAALTAPGATTKSDGASRPCTCHPDDKPPEPCPQKFAYTECVEATKPSDPSSTRSDVTEEIKHLISSARAFLAHFNPCDLAEDKSQQWQSLEHQCNRVERALLDQFEIRSRP